MMEILPDIFSEVEVSLFDEDILGKLCDVMNDVVAPFFDKWMSSPEANQELVARIKPYISKAIDTYTMHEKISADGTLDLIKTISPESILDANGDHEELMRKLEHLEEIYPDLPLSVPPTKKDAFEVFVSAVARIKLIAMTQNVELEHPDFLENLKRNSVIFYKPHDKGHSTRCRVVANKKQSWTMCLRGLQYENYCEQHGIPLEQRRTF